MAKIVDMFDKLGAKLDELIGKIAPKLSPSPSPSPSSKSTNPLEEELKEVAKEISNLELPEKLAASYKRLAEIKDKNSVLTQILNFLPGQKGGPQWKQTAEGLMEGVSKGQTGSKTLGQVNEVVRELGGMIPVIGPLIKGLGSMGTALFGAVDKLTEWGWNLANTNLKFAEFSGAMSRVKMNQRVADIQYSQQRGDARAQGTQEMLDTLNDLRDAWAPIEDTINEIAMDFLKPMLQGITGILRWFTGQPRNLPQRVANRSEMGQVWEQLTRNGWNTWYPGGGGMQFGPQGINPTPNLVW